MKIGKVKGSVTVEAAVIIPLILFVFAVSVYILFYLHDKNILTSVSHETVVCATGYESFGEEEMEEYFQNRIRGKLFLFDHIYSNAKVEEESVLLECKASKNRMRLQVIQKMKKTCPESYIRKAKRTKIFGAEIGGQGENLLQK